MASNILTLLKKKLSDPFTSSVDRGPNPDPQNDNFTTTDTPIEDLGGLKSKEELGDPYAGIDKLFTPNAADEQFKQHLLSMPNENDYKQGFGKKLLTALAAAGAGFTSGPIAGVKLAESIKEDPYKKDLNKWQMKGQSIKDLSGIEDKNQGKQINAFKTKEEVRKDLSNEDLKREKDKNTTLEKQIADKDRARGLDRLDQTLAETKRHNEVDESINRDRVNNTVNTKELKDTQKAYDQRMKPFRDREAMADSDFAKIQALAANPTAQSDYGLLQSFVHSLDNTAAREGEVRTAQSAQNLKQRVDTWMSKFSNNPRMLDPEAIKSFVSAAKSIHDSLKGSGNAAKAQIQNEYKSYADRHGLDFEDVSRGEKLQGSNDAGVSGGNKLTQDQIDKMTQDYLSKHR